MADNRDTGRRDRRAISRGGRRDGDHKKPWYMRRRLWLAVASLMYVGWRRVTGRPPRPAARRDSNQAA